MWQVSLVSIIAKIDVSRNFLPACCLQRITWVLCLFKGEVLVTTGVWSVKSILINENGLQSNEIESGIRSFINESSSNEIS